MSNNWNEIINWLNKGYRITRKDWIVNDEEETLISQQYICLTSNDKELYKSLKDENNQNYIVTYLDLESEWFKLYPDKSQLFYENKEQYEELLDNIRDTTLKEEVIECINTLENFITEYSKIFERQINYEVDTPYNQKYFVNSTNYGVKK